MDIKENNGRIYLSTNDYSVATNYEIKKTSERLGGWSGPDGGYHSSRWDYYPRFFRKISKNGLWFPVYVEEKNPKKIIFMSVTRTTGNKEYSDMSTGSRYSYPNNLENIIKYLSKKGVNDELLLRFKKRAREIM